jgi:hypothetical protein
MRGKVYDAKYNPKPEPVREAGHYTLLRMPESAPKHTTMSAMVEPVLTTTSLRQRVEGGAFEPQPKTKKTYRIQLGSGPDAGWIDLDEDQYQNHLRKTRERDAEAQRRANIAAEQARVDEQHRLEDQRRARLVEFMAEEDRKEALKQAQRLESSLAKATITTAMESFGATVEEIQNVGSRLRAMGLHLIPDMWVTTLSEIRAEKK